MMAIGNMNPNGTGFVALRSRRATRSSPGPKSGKPLGRYFPEMVALLGGVRAARFVVDGELVIGIDSEFSFDALQARLHPAESRIRELAAETPARLILLDILIAPDGANLLRSPLTFRRAALERFIETSGIANQLTLSPTTRDRRVAEKWLHEAGQGLLDGVVAKRLDGAYQVGERAMIKVKPHRTADCVVGGFRYLSNRPEVGSLLLGLYDREGRLNHVGFTSTMPNQRPSGADPPVGGAPRAARLYRKCTRRPEPVEHGAFRRAAALAPRIGG